MKELAPGVLQLKGGLPLPNSINTYLLEDVLVDAGARFDGKNDPQAARGRDLTAHALTHAHPDHQGASKLVCETRGVPFWVPSATWRRRSGPRRSWRSSSGAAMGRLFYQTMHGPGHTVDRTLNEGDEVAGFRVLDVPGHSSGHVAFWRESDRVLILGDVLNNMDVFTGIPGLPLPKDAVTADPRKPPLDQAAGRARAVAGAASATARRCATRRSSPPSARRLMARHRGHAPAARCPPRRTRSGSCSATPRATRSGSSRHRRGDAHRRSGRAGSTYDEINPIAGPWKGRSRWTVTTFDAPHRQVHRGEGIAPTVKWMEVEMAVTPVGEDACEVTLTLRGESALGPGRRADVARTARKGGRGQPQDRREAGRARGARGAADVTSP